MRTCELRIKQPRDYLVLTTRNATVFQKMSDKMKANWSPQPIENQLTRPQLRPFADRGEFSDRRKTTVLPIYQESGVCRLLNNERIRRTFSGLGLDASW